MINIAVFVSGSGSNLQAIIDAINADELDAKICLVVASKPGTYAIERAQAANIPTFEMQIKDYVDPEIADQILVDKLASANEGAQPDYIVLAGYMRKIGPALLAAYPQRIVNLHPALLPSFKGAHAIKDAFDCGVKYTGVTVHYVNAEYDEGKIIAQAVVKIQPDDTLETLERRIHDVEHKLLLNVLNRLSQMNNEK